MTALRSTTEPPWYKQFWPWFLIVLPTVAVIASFTSLYIAIKHADTPVHDDYVQHGLTVLHKASLQTTTLQTTTPDTRDAQQRQ